MARIAKSSVHAAIEQAARQIVQAAGRDRIAQPHEIQAQIEQLQGTEQALVDVFYRFVQHRTHREGGAITVEQAMKAVEYAKEKLIDRYDVNFNGLSRSEIENMSETGQLAVQLAREMNDPHGPFSPESLAKRFAEAAEGLTFVSEIETPYEAFWLPSRAEGPYDMDTFKTALGLDEDANIAVQPASYFFRIYQDPDMHTMVDEGDRYADLEKLMRAYLDKIGLIRVGATEAHEGDVYIAGHAGQNSFVGLKTHRRWS